MTALIRSLRPSTQMEVLEHGLSFLAYVSARHDDFNRSTYAQAHLRHSAQLVQRAPLHNNIPQLIVSPDLREDLDLRTAGGSGNRSMRRSGCGTRPLPQCTCHSSSDTSCTRIILTNYNSAEPGLGAPRCGTRALIGARSRSAHPIPASSTP